MLISSIILTIGCLTNATQTIETPFPTSEPGYANPIALEDYKWLQDHLNDPNLKLIEISPSLEDYNEKHIPGALFIDRNTAIADPESPLRNTLASREQIELVLGQIGLKRTDTVVVYDEGGNVYAGRLYWVLKYYGHRDVRFLEGGKRLLETNNFQLTDEKTEYKTSEYIISEWNSEYLVTMDYVLNNLENPDIVLLDVRSAEEYNGTDIRADRGGHIPGAVNVDWSEAMNPDGTLKSADMLRKLYESRGVTPDKKIITYCSSGVRAAFSWFVLKELLGYPDVTLYDGSWDEWGNTPIVPVVTGNNPG